MAEWLQVGLLGVLVLLTLYQRFGTRPIERIAFKVRRWINLKREGDE